MVDRSAVIKAVNESVNQGPLNSFADPVNMGVQATSGVNTLASLQSKLPNEHPQLNIQKDEPVLQNQSVVPSVQPAENLTVGQAVSDNLNNG